MGPARSRSIVRERGGARFVRGVMGESGRRLSHKAGRAQQVIGSSSLRAKAVEEQGRGKWVRAEKLGSTAAIFEGTGTFPAARFCAAVAESPALRGLLRRRLVATRMVSLSPPS